MNAGLTGIFGGVPTFNLRPRTVRYSWVTTVTSGVRGLVPYLILSLFTVRRRVFRADCDIIWKAVFWSGEMQVVESRLVYAR